MVSRLVRFYDIGALAAFLAMMACVLLEVVTRNIIHIPTPWAEESSRFFCVWTVFLGSASAWFRNLSTSAQAWPRISTRWAISSWIYGHVQVGLGIGLGRRLCRLGEDVGHHDARVGLEGDRTDHALAGVRIGEHRSSRSTSYWMPL